MADAPVPLSDRTLRVTLPAWAWRALAEAARRLAESDPKACEVFDTRTREGLVSGRSRLLQAAGHLERCAGSADRDIEVEASETGLVMVAGAASHARHGLRAGHLLTVRHSEWLHCRDERWIQEIPRTRPQRRKVPA